MVKLVYVLKRVISALIDLIFFALIIKLIEPIIGMQDVDKSYYVSSSYIIPMFFGIYIFQDIFFGKTIGKYFMKFEIKFIDNRKNQNIKKLND